MNIALYVLLYKLQAVKNTDGCSLLSISNNFCSYQFLSLDIEW